VRENSRGSAAASRATPTGARCRVRRLRLCLHTPHSGHIRQLPRVSPRARNFRLFAGKRGRDFDLSLALEKLRTKFGVKRLMLEGGGETNGSFLREGLVDELSLLLTPVADGQPGEPALFDVEGMRSRKALAKLRLKSVQRAASDMLWIKYAVRTNRRAD
jgi:riboflavin biosynthesis pyrimidine reductase